MSEPLYKGNKGHAEFIVHGDWHGFSNDDVLVAILRYLGRKDKTALDKIEEYALEEQGRRWESEA